MKRFLILFAFLPLCAFAQQSGSPFKGFTDNKEKPINFEADRAEVYDTEKKAILIGNVKIIQGESTITAKSVIMWYENEEETKISKEKQKTSAASKNDGQTVKQIDMLGDVVITSKNQKATSNNGVYFAKTEIAILTGNVVLTQCKNIMFGEKLTIKVDINEAKFDAPKNGRVSGVLFTKDNTDDNGGCVGEAPPTPAQINFPNRPPAIQEVAPLAKPTPKPAPKPKSGG